ncbi:hypothetical protein DFQ05_0833 [Winogradskyella wandonensis]|uniref:LTXXQ motif family protein n=1 Tax=Winogradskyella wandonensis TaxID=1442586 RepID=A0A4R1KVT7_9FLAO|nr:hypothetical protein [Winogradskyella wandonensis]TCK69312.1 hypothetical protein DFQ05_0833 [Winogradskyella wandonensis]
MKKIIYTLILSLFVAQGFAQDPLLQRNNETLDEIATKITRTYDDKLSLEGEQFMLFQKKVEEFLIREEKIHNNYSGKQKLDLINELRKAETMEMRNVLTQIQFDLYKRIKPEIQPLAVVKTENN